MGGRSTGTCERHGTDMIDGQCQLCYREAHPDDNPQTREGPGMKKVVWKCEKCEKIRYTDLTAKHQDYRCSLCGEKLVKMKYHVRIENHENGQEFDFWTNDVYKAFNKVKNLIWLLEKEGT